MVGEEDVVIGVDISMYRIVIIELEASFVQAERHAAIHKEALS